MVDLIARAARWTLASAFALLVSCPSALADGCGTGQEPDRRMLAFPSGGVERMALVYVSTGYRQGDKAPLVLDLHGSASDATEQMDRGQWERSAEMHGFVAAALQGLLAAQPSGWRWNVPGVTGPDGPDDERYISDAIDAIADKFCIDRSRVYASGYSGGPHAGAVRLRSS